MRRDEENNKGKGIFKSPIKPLLLDIDRPLPLGTRVTFLTTNREVRSATVVQAGYYVLVVYNEDTSIAIIRYIDLLSVG